MSKLLEQLKRKPVPHKLNRVGVAIPTTMDKVHIKVAIINNADDSTLDRSQYKLKLVGKLPVNKTESAPEKKREITKRKELPIGKPTKLSTRLYLLYDPYVYAPDDKTDEAIASKRKLSKSKKAETDIPKSVSKSTKTIKSMIPNLEIDEKHRETYKPEDQLEIEVSSYYLNNREFFINSISKLFDKNFKDDEQTIADMDTDCNKDTDVMSLMTHQKIVKEYINVYTPYRGLLLYHGLGSGKTCSSIAILEGMKTHSQVMILTPASLEKNYRTQLKQCGDQIYRYNQHWVKTDISKDDADILEEAALASSIDKAFILKQGGIWLTDPIQTPNYKELSSDNKKEVDAQLDKMLEHKFKFVRYNGLRERHIMKYTNNYTKNMFDNTTVIIDEAHNFISRIVNKLNQPKSIAKKLYKYLLEADRCKIILLTGTPIINYPNEMGVMFNILRGLIITWVIKLDVPANITEETFQTMFAPLGTVDYLSYKPGNTTLTITKNPYGFYNVESVTKKYIGVKLDERGNMSNGDFKDIIITTLKKNKINIINISEMSHKALPDNIEEFGQMFINKSGVLENKRLLQKRILGLVSYLGDKKELMPEIGPTARYERREPQSKFCLLSKQS